jgi:hypothetical protein
MDLNLRPELEQHLRQRLQAFGEGFRHNLALIGPPGSGKTFQLQRLLIESPPPFLLVYCPLYRESCRTFFQRFLSAVLQTGLGKSAQQPLEELLRQADSELPRTAEAVRSLEPLLGRRLYGEAFNRALDTVRTLMEERGRPCALILDEFLFLEDLGLGHAFHELGKRVMTWPSALFVLASSSPHRARTILRERLQLLFGQFELLSLGPLDPDHATVWVQQELRMVRGGKAMSPFLVRWLGAYPWYLSVFLKRLKELAALGRQPDTESLFLQTAWDLLGRTEGTLHQWCASRLEGLSRGRLGTRAVDALLHTAEGVRTATKIGERIGRAGLSDALQLLVERDLVQRNGMCWMVPDPVLRCWLSAVLVPQRSGLSPDDAVLRQRFEQYLRALWGQWTQAHQLSFTDQVVGLFHKFSDETVSLDSKTGRLPKFQRISTQRPGAAEGEAYLVAEGEGKRWCVTVQGGAANEQTVASFEAFCRSQTPKPSRKVVIMRSNMDPNAKLLAKAANMWVWEPGELQTLLDLYTNG